MTRTDYITLSPRFAAIAEACGGNRFAHVTGTHAAIVRRNAHQSSIVVNARATRVAGAVPAVCAALVAEAPVIAEGRRAAARNARTRAAELLVEADALDAEAAAIDAALAHAKEIA